MRKVILFGHTGEIGKYLAHDLCSDFDIITFSRSDGFDIARRDQIEDVISSNSDAYAVINCTLARKAPCPLHKLQEKDIIESFSVNLFPVFYIVSAINTYMKNSRFIHFSSVAVNGISGQGLYSACKGGLESLSRSAAIEMNEFNNQIFTIRLGPVSGEKKHFQDKYRQYHDTLQDSLINKSISRQKTALREVRNLVNLLLCAENSNFHGNIITLDGGLSGL
ncbi:MAG: SDR family oxidoreductase [Candidatus Muiribacteriaceae bacterium]